MPMFPLIRGGRGVRTILEPYIPVDTFHPLPMYKRVPKGFSLRGLGSVITYCNSNPPDDLTKKIITDRGDTFSLVDCAPNTVYNVINSAGSVVQAPAGGIPATGSAKGIPGIAQPSCSAIPAPTLITSRQVCIPSPDSAPNCVSSDVSLAIQQYNMRQHDRYNALIFNCQCKQAAWLNGDAVGYAACDSKYPVPSAPTPPSGITPDVGYYATDIYGSGTVKYSGTVFDKGTGTQAPPPQPPSSSASKQSGAETQTLVQRMQANAPLDYGQAILDTIQSTEESVGLGIDPKWILFGLGGLALVFAMKK